jgi:hypothetical protein
MDIWWIFSVYPKIVHSISGQRKGNFTILMNIFGEKNAKDCGENVLASVSI